MKSITFYIHYQTIYGQQLAVVGPMTELGAGDADQAFPLQFTKNGWWKGVLQLEELPKTLMYQYVLLDDQKNIVQEEWGDPRQLALPGSETITLLDTWRAGQHPDNSLMTSAFTGAVFRPEPVESGAASKKGEGRLLTFNLRCPRTEAGYDLVVCGNLPELGGWDVRQGVVLGNENYPQWTGTVRLAQPAAAEYKYVWRSRQEGDPIWETGANRRIEWGSEAGEVVVSDEYFQHPAGHWKGAGLAIPVFSIRSRKSFGVGEFADIRLLVDWAKQSGLKMVQILPVNDTTVKLTWEDSYPYEAISVFALHPIYLRLEALPGFKEAVKQKQFDREREKLNAHSHLEYEGVIKGKLKYARAAFAVEKNTFLQSRAFKKFLKVSEHWLKPYAAFSYLRDQYGTADFTQWGEHSIFSEKLLRKLTSAKAAHYDEIAFYYYLQFHLDLQLSNAADYARSHGVVLKGDIPIGINRESVDAWVAPHLYNMRGQAGAPPDAFAVKGQNWGFPTYDWDRMAEDGYQWWRDRFSQLTRYFDAFRIDHILGFFRIWQIPLEQVEGIMGFFNPAIPVEIDEFAARGIPFDYDRFCKPYLPEEFVDATFGDEAGYVKEHFLQVSSPGFFELHPDFATQKQAEAYFEDPANDVRKHLKIGLYDLISNLLFFEVPGSEGRQFHPRISLDATYSFQALDGWQQQKVHDLYIDYFYRRQNDFWEEKAMQKLPAIRKATNMLICGEDLGMVPECVPGVMHELEILSLEIQRMSKNPATEFLVEKDIPYMSVCSPSTHDMAPIRLWWQDAEEDQPRMQRFYNHILGMPGMRPPHCEPYIAEAIIKQHLHWPCMWAVFPLQDLIAIDGNLRFPNPAEERINVPSNPNHYWRYRFHMNLEDLMQADDFNERVRSMLLRSGR